MLQINIHIYILISVLFLISCNQSTTTSKNDKDTTAALTNNDTSAIPVYNPAMDPLTVGAAFSKSLEIH
jgi:hypothetical protein